MSFLLIFLSEAAAPARQPYVIQETGRTIVGYWEERGVQSGGKVRVELDTPWLSTPQWEMVTLKNLVSAPVAERPAKTAERRKRGFEEAGLVQLSDTVAVPKEDYELAQRAREMAGVDKPQGEDGEVAVETDAEEIIPTGAVASRPGSGPPLPGFWEQWGGHIGLVVVAVLLTGLVVRMTFLAAD